MFLSHSQSLAARWPRLSGSGSGFGLRLVGVFQKLWSRVQSESVAQTVGRDYNWVAQETLKTKEGSIRRGRYTSMNRRRYKRKPTRMSALLWRESTSGGADLGSIGWQGPGSANQAFAQSVARQTGDIMDIKLVHRRLAVFLNRLDANPESIGYFLIGLSPGD